jgi:glycosyltransferase involved in cell wall biosynthesis
LAESTNATAIVPTYNRAHYLGDTLDSILAQTIAPAQIIVVDDGSSDATRSIIERYGSSISYIYKDNGGKAEALNTAMRFAGGEYIWIMDDDDLAEPDALEQLWKCLRANPRAGFVFGEHSHFSVDEAEQVHVRMSKRPSFKLDKLYPSLLAECFIFQPEMLVRRQCYAEVGPFDNSLVRSQDYDMLLRLSKKYKAAQVDHIVFRQRQHDGPRGSAGLQIPGDEVWQRQASFDEIVIDKALKNSVLADFGGIREHASVPFSRFERNAALLERARVLARRGRAHLAYQDLKEAMRDKEALSLLDKDDLETIASELVKHLLKESTVPNKIPALIKLVLLPASSLKTAIFIQFRNKALRALQMRLKLI